jgi:tetratricopeptide (TPR) repeat protein
VIVRVTRLWLAPLLTGLLAACAPALKALPPITQLGAQSGSTRPETSTPADVDRLLAEADAQFSLRPDLKAATKAYATFLAAARADETRIDGLLNAARTAGWLIEHEPSAERRRALATEAVQVGQWCRQRAPSALACKYRLALALGQQAREHPGTGNDGLNKMIALLEEVIATDPLLDKAGGHRVLALLQLRAPGWPLGPGDSDAALEHARKADALVPDDADNLLVLGEALAATGAAEQARLAYQRARTIAQARAAGGDPDAAEIIESALRALKKLAM